MERPASLQLTVDLLVKLPQQATVSKPQEAVGLVHESATEIPSPRPEAPRSTGQYGKQCG